MRGWGIECNHIAISGRRGVGAGGGARAGLFFQTYSTLITVHYTLSASAAPPHHMVLAHSAGRSHGTRQSDVYRV